MLTVLLVLTLTVTGLLVGVELAVAAVLNPILRALPFEASMSGLAHGARVLGAVMPFWYVSALALVVASALAMDAPGAVGTAIAASALLLVSCVASVVLLVPINRRARAWTAQDHPADWAEQRLRWDRLHLMRVALLVLALLLVSLSIVIR